MTSFSGQAGVGKYHIESLRIGFISIFFEIIPSVTKSLF